MRHPFAHCRVVYRAAQVVFFEPAVKVATYVYIENKGLCVYLFALPHAVPRVYFKPAYLYRIQTFPLRILSYSSAMASAFSLTS